MALTLAFQIAIARACRTREKKMLDLLMALFTGLFFAVALVYIKGCEHLR